MTPENKEIRIVVELNSYLLGFVLGAIDNAIQEILDRGSDVHEDVLKLYNLLALEFQVPYVKEMNQDES